ncbi:MFS transporter [Pseudoclavibacter sp. VKM Ac-2867]|uniref:MFS transporter n=1 Tax=Pseudoclavibacter sp. VKM Ac-2867 TaxID=2783829 RepID=UPI002B268BA1|nr:MFS transporter [Pseudoclavibacter sp. VKM Ac-2867]
MLSRPISFALAGLAGAATLTAASAPSPLYPVYQQLWGFSSFTLTVIFAAYVVALLVALLTVGSLSDRIGRRPVASASLVLLTLGMVLFATADSTGALVAARLVQGFAVGAATGTFTAMIIDKAPSARSGSLVSSAVPSLGIAFGAVLAGALVEFAPFPRQLVFWILAVSYLVIAALIWLVPERVRPDSPTPRSIWRSLLPSIGLPPAARSIFFALVPSIAATWALGGLCLSLGSSILGTVLGVQSHFTIGLVLGVFFVAGTVGTAISAFLPPRLGTLFGYGALILGVLITIAALVMADTPLYIAGSAIAGLGFGATFRLAVGALGEAAPDAERGQVFSTMYIVSYIAFSVPALVAGLAVERFGLEPTAVVYGALDVALVVIAIVAGLVRARRQAAVVPDGASASQPQPVSR